MTTCFPFFGSKKSKKDKKVNQPTSQDIDDVTTPSTHTPVVNTPEAEALLNQQPTTTTAPAEVTPTTTPAATREAAPVLPAATASTVVKDDEPEVTTHTHTHEVVTIKEYITPPNNGPTEKELASELKAAQAELKCNLLKCQVLQDENVNLLEKNLELENLKKDNLAKAQEIEKLKNEVKLQKEKINKSEDEVKIYQTHINTAGQEINLLKRKLKKDKHQELDKTIELLLTGLKEAYDEISNLDEKEKDYIVMANESGEEIYELKKKLRDTTTLINECGQELVDTKVENANLKYENDVFGKLITCMAYELQAANKKIEEFQESTKELMLIANETGEEIIKLQNNTRDKAVAINETGQEICNLKYEMSELTKENLLLKEVFKTLLNEYKIVKEECDDLKNKENDLLVFANEAGEEITNLRRVQKDNVASLNEAGNELILSKSECSQLKTNVQQYETLLEVAGNKLFEANGIIEKLQSENSDLMVFANESGEEIANLKNIQKDNSLHIMEACQELIDNKDELKQVKQQNEVYLSFIVAIGEQFKSVLDENNSLQFEKDDTYKLANEVGEEIIKLQEKLRDANFTLNECGSELISTKDELNEIKSQNVNYEQIITGLVEMLDKTKAELASMESREKDLLALANETGEEIRSLRLKNNDAKLIANETGSELVDLKMELKRVNEELSQCKEQLKNNMTKKIEMNLNELKNEMHQVEA